MTIMIKSSLIAIAILGSAPLIAQPQYQAGYGQQTQSQWNRDDFWHGAPDGITDRIAFLNRRIDRSLADGRINRRAARDARTELTAIGRDARRAGRQMSPQRQDVLQARLDRISQGLNWRGDARADGYGRDNGPGRGQAYDADRPSYGNDRPSQYDERQFATSYDASRDYRDGTGYSERRLSADDQVYRGSDGRYYCKRNDGTTGLIVGALGGGVLGNVIDGGHNRVAGTLIGGALGALAGKSIEQSNDVRCK